MFCLSKKKFWIEAVAFFVLAEGCVLSARSLVQIRSIEERQETIADKVFLQRRKNLEGVVSRFWFVDGQPVDQAAFEEQLSLAAAQDAVNDLRQEEARFIERHEFARVSRKALYKKLAATIQEEILAYLTRVTIIDLSSFFEFSSCTFDSQMEFEAAYRWVRQDVNVELDASENDEALYDVMLRYEQLQKKIELFYQAAIKRAIDECSDTRVLKELLTLVS
ncbi:MAG: hypothetical protein UV79_C0009G0019 [candidate division TM6 bacterium GW2011_GWF2_43_17]|nr:MAG: hypothetical protein UV79_C0009G0019 [candidate division TM6 bacterium GW2011_GWF2_43_17]HAU30382.1 hypothetical protein [Candidatus Dependentiae bacterium]